ncbi:hypothetical protein JCM5353_006735 [Sporobolomyces roseus]
MPRPRSSTTTSNTQPDLKLDEDQQDLEITTSSTTKKGGKSVDGSSTASPSGSKVAKKKSQRPSWSCTECTRRKIRCDRVVPGCNQCIKRGKVHLCRLDQDVDLGFGGPPPNSLPSTSAAGAASFDSNTPPGQPRLATASEYDAITRSVNVVRQRLCHLERVMRAFVPQSGEFDENGQPLFGINMDLLAATATMSREQSVGYEGAAGGGGGGGGGGGATAATPGLPIPPQDSYNGHGGGEYEPKAGFQDPRFSLPPAPMPLERIRDSESERRMADSDGEVEAAVTLEYLALGRDRKEDHFHRAELRRPEEDDESTSPAQVPNNSVPDSISAPQGESTTRVGASGASTFFDGRQTHKDIAEILPSPTLSEFIINYSLDQVCWQHGAVHAGQFKAEHLEFLSWGEKRSELVNQSFLALYFALCCIGVKHMSEQEALDGGISADDRKRLPRLYFDAAIAALHRANFLSKHSIYTIQTIVIVVVTCQDVGGSDLIATLLACGIRIAQHLNIHRFGSDAEWESRRRANGVDPKSQEGIKGLIQRELRKRLWYALTIEDWLSIPFRRACSISPTHFTTPLPLNCHDSDLSDGNMIQRPHEEPTTVTKILFTYQVAACIRRFFEDVNCSTSRGGPSYELCLDVDRQIRAIINDGPAFLKVDHAGSEEWVKNLRHYYIISVSHKLLICHRVFLGRSFRDPRYAYSRRSAIEAARSVIQEIARGGHPHYQQLWTLPFHTIAASTTIILDIFQSSSVDPDTPNKRQEVQVALEELRKLSNEGSSIASRGVQLLSTLLAEEAKHRRIPLPPSDSRKRRASGSAPGEGERFGDVAKRVASNSRTSLNGGSPSSSSLQASPNFASTTFPYFAPTLPSANTGVGFEHQSPADSHLSDGLNQDAFDAILQGLNGYSGSENLGDVGGSNGMAGIAGDAATAEFWRNFDSTFEPSTLEMLGGLADAGMDYDGMSGAGTGTPTNGSFTTPW